MLPPQSSQLNPIERLWGMVKGAWRKENTKRTVAEKPDRDIVEELGRVLRDYETAGDKADRLEHIPTCCFKLMADHLQARPPHYPAGMPHW